MFEARREQESPITLCIFPHQDEFLAIDTRPGLPGRPLVKTLTHEALRSGEFFRRMEGDFSKLLRRQNVGFLGMIAMPQEVEGLMRSHALRRVMELLNADTPGADAAEPGGVGLLLFNGQLLTVPEDQLKEIVKDMFDDRLTPGQINSLHSTLWGLAKKERDAETAATKAELSRLITGEGGPYVTIWGRDQN